MWGRTVPGRLTPPPGAAGRLKGNKESAHNPFVGLPVFSVEAGRQQQHLLIQRGCDGTSGT